MQLLVSRLLAYRTVYNHQKDAFLFHQACSRRSPDCCWPIKPFTVIQKMFAVVVSFVIGLLGSFVLNVESLADTRLPDGLELIQEIRLFFPRNAFIVHRLYS